MGSDHHNCRGWWYARNLIPYKIITGWPVDEWREADLPDGGLHTPSGDDWLCGMQVCLFV
jgi:hypothetical protein